MRTRLPLALLLALVLASSAAARADESALQGRVVEVVDGDTLVLESEGENRSIRLSEIDAPERDQPHGAESKRALYELAHGRAARVVVVDRDRYGRWVGEVWIDGVQVNHQMVRLGHAWAYTRYARSVRVVELEDEARAAHRGLWRLEPAAREAPWEWRRKGRAASAGKRRPPAKPEVIVCGSKTRCAEMNTCEEARAYHRECGASRLDGDGDGLPCEQLCR